MTEYSRDAWINSWFDTLARDVRCALRSSARNPGFTLVALLTLALGIGANTAIFRLVMLRALPVSAPTSCSRSAARSRIVPDVTMATGDQPLGTGSAELVTGNFFSVLGVRPVLGRPIAPDDDRAAGAGPVAVISHGLWKRAFAASPDVLGRTIRLKGGLAGGGTSGFEPDAPNAPRADEAVLTTARVPL
jgi:hypothetical protein